MAVFTTKCFSVVISISISQVSDKSDFTIAFSREFSIRTIHEFTFENYRQLFSGATLQLFSIVQKFKKKNFNIRLLTLVIYSDKYSSLLNILKKISMVDLTSFDYVDIFLIRL